MSAEFKRVVHRAKAVLCLILMLQAQLMINGGCGTSGGLLSPAQQLRIPLPSSHPLSQALSGSPFAGATALNVYPTSQRFDLELRDPTKQLSGKYAYRDGEFAITEFYTQNRGRSATLWIDESKRVSRIATSDGVDWKLSDVSARTDGDASATVGVDAYLEANVALLEVARQLDEEFAASGEAPTSIATAGSTSTDDKTTASLSDPLRIALVLIAGIWYPIAGIVTQLVTIFTVSTVLQSALVLRFDGTWSATNASSELIVTVSGGKITRLVDSSSGQQLDITDTQLTSVNGNQIVWTVDASVLGQTPTVTFEFDVQELSDGSLKGTLTTLGSSFARVPVTMTRAPSAG
jgi:hypothetical protein